MALPSRSPCSSKAISSGSGRARPFVADASVVAPGAAHFAAVGSGQHAFTVEASEAKAAGIEAAIGAIEAALP